jgi:type IV secretion system protein VirB6
MLMVLIVSSKMVSGWTVFGFATPDKADSRAFEPALASMAQPLTPAQDRASQLAPKAAPAGGQRRIDVAIPVVQAANDTGAAGGTIIRETKVFATSAGNGQNAGGAPATSRTRGIGNRFRSAGSASRGFSKSEKTK